MQVESAMVAPGGDGASADADTVAVAGGGGGGGGGDGGGECVGGACRVATVVSSRNHE